MRYLKEYRIVSVLYILSFLVLLFYTDFDVVLSFRYATIQLIVSWIIGYGFTQVYVKYQDTSYIKWWSLFYTLMVFGTLIMKYLKNFE